MRSGAMRLIRSRATDFRIDPVRLGAIGFSAGGHLAADVATSFDQRTYAPVDAADALSARPAFLGLIYPVISLDTAISLGASSPNLLGPDPSAELIAARSPALHVTAQTPPSFVAAAFDDGLILVDNSLIWIDACRRARAPVESHLFSEGGHGFGFHLPRDLPSSRWPDLFAQWMRKHGG
jgi:acetyl esterase/lipase